MPMLNINSEIVCQIIDKLQEVHAKEEVIFDEKVADSEYEYDWAQILADHDDDKTYIEIKNVIDELEPDQKIDLLTLFFIGRDDYDSGEWNMAREEAMTHTILQHIPEFLLSQPLSSDYLRKGLEYLNLSCDED